MRLGVIGAGSFGAEVLKIVASLPNIEIAHAPSFRSLILQARKAMLRCRPPKPMIHMLDYAQRWAATVDWISVEGTRRSRMLAGTGR